MRVESSDDDGPSKLTESLEVIEVLTRGEMGECHLVPSGSNYTFFTTISYDSSSTYRAVYKPRRGEVPLWDFPDGTLYIREYAAYLLCEALGWGFVPPTVIREGWYGIGSVQLFVETDSRHNYFTLRKACLEECLRICTFDIIANNADRKASHCILDVEGLVWAIDHGVTFHSETKLRTVIWDFIGDPLPKSIIADLNHLQKQFGAVGGLGEQLQLLISPPEVESCLDRLNYLLEHPSYPAPSSQFPVPWPFI